MANTIYTRWLAVQNNKQYGWDSGTTVRAMLCDGSSTYVPDKDHRTVREILNNGFVEIAGQGYVRADVQDKVVYQDDVNDEIQFRCTNLNFGPIEAGKTVKAILLFIRTGTNDNPDNDIPIVYIDTATGLPATTGGGVFVFAVPTTGLFRAYAQ